MAKYDIKDNTGRTIGTAESYHSTSSDKLADALLASAKRQRDIQRDIQQKAEWLEGYIKELEHKSEQQRIKAEMEKEQLAQSLAAMTPEDREEYKRREDAYVAERTLQIQKITEETEEKESWYKYGIKSYEEAKEHEDILGREYVNDLREKKEKLAKGQEEIRKLKNEILERTMCFHPEIVREIHRDRILAGHTDSQRAEYNAKAEAKIASLTRECDSYTSRARSLPKKAENRTGRAIEIPIILFIALIILTSFMDERNDTQSLIGRTLIIGSFVFSVVYALYTVIKNKLEAKELKKLERLVAYNQKKIEELKYDYVEFE